MPGGRCAGETLTGRWMWPHPSNPPRDWNIHLSWGYSTRWSQQTLLSLKNNSGKIGLVKMCCLIMSPVLGDCDKVVSWAECALGPVEPLFFHSLGAALYVKGGVSTDTPHPLLQDDPETYQTEYEWKSQTWALSAESGEIEKCQCQFTLTMGWGRGQRKQRSAVFGFEVC